MRINFSTLLPFLFYVFKGTSAQTPRDVVTYTTKTVEKLECSFTSTVIVQWIEQKDDGNINLFLYDVRDGLVQKQTNDSKYDNFHYSIEGTNGFNLVINNVDKGDGGHYLCIRITSPAVSFDVNVEVLPESINIHCTEISACLPSAEKEADPQINCLCAATGLRSSGLEIEWDGVDTFTASDTTRVKNPTSGSFIIRSNITLPSPNGTASVSCSLTGYRSQIPKRLRSYTYTFSPPVCNLVHYCPSDGTNASLICSCSRGSPKVNAYSFYDSQKSPIGTQRSSSKSVQVEANKIEMFFCSGCNGVSDNQIVGLEFNCKQGSALWIFIVIVIVILLLLVFAAITFLVVKKPRSAKRKVGAGPKRRKEGDGDEEHPLYDNTTAQDQKLHDPRSEDLKGKNPVPLGGGQAPDKDDTKGNQDGTDLDQVVKEKKQQTGNEGGNQEGTDLDQVLKEKKQQTGNEGDKQGGTDVDQGREGEKQQTNNEDEKKNVPSTKERLPGGGKEGAQSAEPMKRWPLANWQSRM